MTPRERGGSFFRTMVLMGSSVAVGSGVALACGGVAELVPGTGGGPGAGGSPGSGGSASGGTQSGGASTGGSVGVGGSGGASSGGMGGLGGAFPTDCPMTQLSCSVPSTSYCQDGYPALPDDCVCDPKRPASADDCSSDEAFVCLGAYLDTQLEPVEDIRPFNCECVPGLTNTYCGSACTAHSEAPYPTCSEPEDDLEAYLCGCALPILK